MWVIDIDDVQADYTMGMIEKYGSPKAWSGGLAKMYPGVDLLTHLANINFLLCLPQVPGAGAGLRSLAMAGYDWVNVTSRPPGAAKVTEQWQKRSSIPFRRTYFTGSNTGKIDWLIANRRWIDVCVDDHPEICEAAYTLGITTLVFDRPWNRSVSVGTRVLGWPHIERTIILGGRCLERETVSRKTRKYVPAGYIRQKAHRYGRVPCGNGGYVPAYDHLGRLAFRQAHHEELRH